MGSFAPLSAFAAAAAAGRDTVGVAKAFHAYSPLHGVIVAVFLAVSGLLSALRRGLRGSPAAERMDRALGVAALIIWGTYKAFAWLPGQRHLESSLPLQVCDVNGLVASMALLSGRRSLRAVLYFWGIGLSTLAFYYPDLQHGPDTAKFWLFWLTHSAIAGSAIYEILGRGFRPTWRDYFTAVAAGVVYVLVILPVDALTGFNYGYVGRTRPGQLPLLDVLGTWPWRIVPMALLAVVVLALLELPFTLTASRPGRNVEIPH